MADFSLVARVISEGYLPARSALLQGPRDVVVGPAPAGRVRGMLMGLAIGDALANTSEGLTTAERTSRYGEIYNYLENHHAGGRRVGLPSDDTQLAFWTLESLLELDGLDEEDLSKRFSSRPIFGVGRSIRQFLQNRRNGVTPWYRCGAQSAGNGALMRIAPIVLLHPNGAGAPLWLDAALASIVTHRDASSVASCVAFCDLLARLLRRTDMPDSDWLVTTFLSTVRHVCTDQSYRPRGGQFASFEGTFPDYLEHVLGEARARNWNIRDACDAWHSGAYLLETVPSVLWILASCADDPEEAVIRAVNDTVDNDTVAAIVGAAVGALHGEEALPLRWRQGLLGRTQAADDGQIFRLLHAAALHRWD